MNSGDLEEYIHYVTTGIRDQEVSFYLDLPGSKLRIGKFNAEMSLGKDEIKNLIPADDSDGNEIPIPSENFFRFIIEGDELLLQDGSIRLSVIKAETSRLITKVNAGGILRSRAGILIKDRIYPFQKQMEHFNIYLELAAAYQIGFLALSYVSSARDLQDLRSHCRNLSYQPALIAKIEFPSALNDLGAIIDASDGLWYCRGDLGTFISPKELADWQDKIIELSLFKKKPVIIAGQVFQYMVTHPQPSRSEVVHFYHMLKQHVSGIVLSDETTLGDFPLETIQQVFSLLP